MKKRTASLLACLMILATFVSGCGVQESDPLKGKLKVGLMLSDVGLGDQSFSDAAFSGLVKARDELDVVFDYRELEDSNTYEEGLRQLVKDQNDLIIGLGFAVQEDLEKVAKDYPKQQFLLVDSQSDLKNVTSITFKEDEGSYLAGVAAAMTTKTKTLGFVGGEKVPLIEKFADGFEKGAKSVDPKMKVIRTYAGSFGDEKLGASLAKDLASQKSDVIYAAAGLTGVGSLKEAENLHIHAIGTDSDQYYFAEKAVVTSMLKNVDIALFNTVKEYKDAGEFPEQHIELGLKEDGVGLAPIRIVSSAKEIQKKVEAAKDEM
ncbi:BMP family lipoprotein [Bacillus massiliglaciei]|uniref:BMP family lipoprotein n=1 Tax=Bacillus massiliglaciei TaxID=1816693 RepID=UPI000AB472DF|nr:BMP family ABC transporter substrate-binding protein [Bacillus massiliglaciei]